jgi:hypothetical protein
MDVHIASGFSCLAQVPDIVEPAASRVRLIQKSVLEQGGGRQSGGKRCIRDHERRG